MNKAEKYLKEKYPFGFKGEFKNILEDVDEDAGYIEIEFLAEKCIKVAEDFANQRVKEVLEASCNKFKEQDLLRAYQAGAIEQQSINLDSLNFEKLKELTKDSEEWYKRYME